MVHLAAEPVPFAAWRSRVIGAVSPLAGRAAAQDEQQVRSIDDVSAPVPVGERARNAPEPARSQSSVAWVASGTSAGVHVKQRVRYARSPSVPPEVIVALY